MKEETDNKKRKTHDGPIEGAAPSLADKTQKNNKEDKKTRRTRKRKALNEDDFVSVIGFVGVVSS